MRSQKGWASKVRLSPVTPLTMHNAYIPFTSDPDPLHHEPASGDVEMPWWTYGARGMQLWFPSPLADPLSPTTREMMGFSASTDPELEFDREVYPVGISLAEVAVVGALSDLHHPPPTPFILPSSPTLRNSTHIAV